MSRYRNRRCWAQINLAGCPRLPQCGRVKSAAVFHFEPRLFPRVCLLFTQDRPSAYKHALYLGRRASDTACVQAFSPRSTFLCPSLVHRDAQLPQLDLGGLDLAHELLMGGGDVVEGQHAPAEEDEEVGAEGDEGPEGKLLESREVSHSVCQVVPR